MHRFLQPVTASLVKYLLLICAIAFTPAATAQLSAEAERGHAWLAAQPGPDGALKDEGGSIATAMQARSETARTLKLRSAIPVPLVDLIAADSDGNTEYLARQAIVLAAAGRATGPLVDALLSRQNADGGFAGAADYQSSPLDTAFALLALKAGRPADPGAARASAYLAERVRGLPPTAGAYLRSIASLALQSSDGSAATLQAIGQVNQSVLALQQADGGWGGVADTSLAYLALAGSNSDTSLQALVTTHLLSRQAANGSWGDDPYTTALALRALTARPALSSTSGGISGRIIDSASGLAIANATVVVDTVPGTQALTDAAGRFSFTGLPPGSYTVQVSAAGYASRTLQFSLPPATTAELGNVLLAKPNTVATIEGIAKDGASGLPLDGVTIALASGGGMAITQADGSYQMTGVAPGDFRVTASKAGYGSVAAEGSAAAGSVLVFSPVMLAQATTGSISGRIVDGASGLPLAGARVSITAATLAVLTGADGRFSLAGVNAGVAVIDISFAGYSSRAINAVVSGGGTTDFQTVPLNKTSTPSTTGTIQGVATDAKTGAVLAGVTIQVGGSATLSAMTGADGSFQIDSAAPGSVSLSASKSGYMTVSASATFGPGSVLVFSPQMPARPVTGVIGRVVDKATQAPLAGVRVDLNQTTQYAAHTISGADGSFALPELLGGSNYLRLSIDGYATRSVAFVGGGSLTDLQSIAMVRSETTVVISGKVTDIETGKALAGAAVAVLGTELAAVTDAAGSYRIEGVAQGNVTIRYSAAGYTGETVILEISAYGVVPIDRALRAGQGSSLALALSTAESAYGAYAPVAIRAVVTNSGGEAQSGTVSFTLIDQQGQFLDSIEATRAVEGGAPERIFSFAPGETAMEVSWNTRSHAPGAYTVLARLQQAQPGADGPGGVELAQKRSEFAITPTAAIGSARLTPLPAYSNVGATEQLGFRLDVVNQSNVPVHSALDYQLLSPAQAAIASGTVTIDMEPGDASQSILLGGPLHKFTASGLYQSTLATASGAAPAQFTSAPVSVAPATRIDPSYSAAPNIVTPDGDKRIKLEIRLQGVEQK